LQHSRWRPSAVHRDPRVSPSRSCYQSSILRLRLPISLAHLFTTMCSPGTLPHSSCCPPPVRRLHLSWSPSCISAKHGEPVSAGHPASELMDFRQCNNEWSGSCSTPATEKPHWAKSSAIGREEPGAGNLENASSDAENASVAKCRIDLPKPHFAEQHRSARRPDNVRHP
jgi:hypothetical protein